MELLGVINRFGEWKGKSKWATFCHPEPVEEQVINDCGYVIPDFDFALRTIWS